LTPSMTDCSDVCVLTSLPSPFQATWTLQTDHHEYLSPAGDGPLHYLLVGEVAEAPYLFPVTGSMMGTTITLLPSILSLRIATHYTRALLLQSAPQTCPAGKHAVEEVSLFRIEVEGSAIDLGVRSRLHGRCWCSRAVLECSRGDPPPQ